MYGVVAYGTVPYGDSSAPGAAKVGAITETLTTTDTVVRVETLARFLSETKVVTDALARVASFHRTDTDSLTTADSVIRRQSSIRAIIETLTTSDSIVRRAGFNRSVNSLFQNLSAYWTFDETNQSITSLVDVTGNTTAGTWQGTTGAQWGPGKINGGGSFNGADNYIDMGNQVPFQATSALSISVWITAPQPSSPVNTRTFLSKFNAGNGYVLWMNPSISTINLNINGTVASFASSLSAGWHHLVATYDGISARLWIDGVGPSTVGLGGNIVDSGTSLLIGHQAGLLNDFYTGALDESSVWLKVLNAGEVSYLYNSGLGRQYPSWPEVLVTTDAVSRAAGLVRKPTDALSTVDLIARRITPSRGLLETLTTSDALSRVLRLFRIISDTQSTLDSMLGIRHTQIHQQLSDTTDQRVSVGDADSSRVGVSDSNNAVVGSSDEAWG